jgi:hypothetical protein
MVMKRRLLTTGLLLLVAVTALLGTATGTSWACTNAQTCSTSYQLNEAFFGNGGSLDTTCSGAYCAKQSLGETGVGNSASTNYQIQAGTNTYRTPSLTLLINDSRCPDYNAGVNLGYLSASTPKTGNANFSVQSYLASGYIVTTVGTPPSSATGHQITPITTSGGGTSSAGTEQFGINLVHNTSPATFGNNPAAPSGSINSNGAASGNYANAGKFYYNNGDTIASSNKSSGTTCYDISYLFNISNVTPAGVYTFNQAVVVTSTF